MTAWSTPLIADFNGKKQVIISATKKVRAYEPETGKLIWECARLGLNVIPHPVQHNDTVLVMNGFSAPRLMAIRPEREGDLTGSDAILRTQTRGMSYSPSPVLHDGKFYALTDNGMLSCFNATTGEPYYHQRRLPQPGNFIASPMAAGGNLYLTSESGVITVIKLGEKFEIVATNTLADHMFVASPAVAEGEMFCGARPTCSASATARQNSDEQDVSSPKLGGTAAAFGMPSNLASSLPKSLVIELRADVDEAQRPKAQALLETLAAVIGGLIKTFDDYERSGL